MSRSLSLRAFAKISIALIIGALVATPASPAVLDEIRVTAQKREQLTQDVGIAISAFTGDQLKTLNIEESFDIATFVPGVHISGNLAGQNTQFTIRGVTQNDFNDIVEGPNAVYLDETYFAIANAQTFAVFDIERVEILKGPQGTLFGRNATGGTVQYVSNKPSLEETEGYIDLTYGQFDTDADADQIKLEAAVGGPLTDTLAGRIAVYMNEHDGYLNNIYGDSGVNDFNFGAATFGFGPANDPGPGSGADMGDDDTIAFRGTLYFEPEESLRFTASVNYADTEVATGPYQSIPTSAVYNGSSPMANVVLSQGELVNVINTAPTDSRASICADGSDCGLDQDNNGAPDDLDGFPGFDTGRIDSSFMPAPGADFYGYIDPDGEDWNTSGDFAFADSGMTEALGLTLRAEWDLSDTTTFTWISDFKDYEKLLFIDVDSAPVNQSANFGGINAQSFTQELRINGETDRIRWLGGLYYLRIDSDSDNGLKFPVNSIVPGPGGGLPNFPFDLGVDASLETDSYSAFGQIEYDFVDQWTLIVGGRVIKEEKDAIVTQNIYLNSNSRFGNVVSPDAPIPTPITIGPNAGAPFTSDTDDTLWAGKVQIDWRATDDVLFYGGINRGVKAGSVNAPLAGGLPIPVSALPYDEEELTSFEVGFKWTLLDGTTRFNGSAYYYDYSDYQAFLFTGVGGIVINADAETTGIELELQTSPVDGLDILLSGSYLDAEVQDVAFRPGTDPAIIVRDVRPVYTPELQFAGLIRYEWPMLGGMGNIQFDASYSDEYFYNLRNFDADQFDSYTLVNGSLGWTNEDESLDVSLILRNITDEHAGIQGFDLATLCGCNEVSYRAPFWYGISARYTF